MKRGGCRLTHSSGQATVELVTLIPFLFLAALLVWEILLLTFVATSAENAARNGSRAETVGDDGGEVAVESLTSWLQDDADVTISGTRVTVSIEAPVIIPGLSTDSFLISRSAELPSG
jgi:hypothetical protein